MKINAHGSALLCYQLESCVVVDVVVDADRMNEYNPIMLSTWVGSLACHSFLTSSCH
jgi:hypothetical protein